MSSADVLDLFLSWILWCNISCLNTTNTTATMTTTNNNTNDNSNDNNTNYKNNSLKLQFSFLRFDSPIQCWCFCSCFCFARERVSRRPSTCWAWRWLSRRVFHSFTTTCCLERRVSFSRCTVWKAKVRTSLCWYGKHNHDYNRHANMGLSCRLVRYYNNNLFFN